MGAGNRSPLGFFPITVFFLCVLLAAVLLQLLYDSWGTLALTVGLAAVVGTLITIAVVRPRFYWDVFRSLKSAAVLITFLVIACILGTLLIQDLDLRRAGVFDAGLAKEGEELPPFDDRNQSTRFALAEAHALLAVWPNEERREMLEAKVKLSDFEKDQVGLRSTAFGSRAGRAFEEAVLASKRRQVEQLTTTHYARQHHSGLYKFYLFCRGLHLFDIFEAWWFKVLLGLIGVTVVIGTIALAPWSWRQAGVAVTHAGVLIVLFGGLADTLAAKEGYMYLKDGKPQERVASSIHDQKNRIYNNLPFRIYLERFATEYYHELLVERIDWSRRHDGKKWSGTNGTGHMGRPFAVRATVPVRAGVERLFEDKKIRVTVHEYKPRVFVRTVVEDRGDGKINPAVKLGLYNNPKGGKNFFVHGNNQPWLFANEEDRCCLDMYGGRFEYVWAENQGHYNRLLRQAPIPDNGTLVLRTKSGDRVSERVVLGQKRTITVGGRAVEVEFVAIRSALEEMKNVNLDRRKQTSEEPVLYLRVAGQPLPVPRDDSAFTRDFNLLEGVEFRFDWPNPKDAGVRSIFRVIEGAGLPQVLVQIDKEGKALAKPMRRGVPVPLIGLEGGYLAVEEHVRSAREGREVEEVTDEEFLREGGGHKDHLLAAWGDVEISGEWGTIRREMTPYDRPIFYGPKGERPVYAFSLVKTQQQRDWFSVLNVLDNQGNKLKSHAVQVNDPLRYGGYRFFQATAATDRDGLGVSGISVTRNPGVTFMYVGYTVLTIGVCWIFFARPIIDRRRRRRNRSAA
ncbi:MAG: cytochrome c biogenesis protein ResB [Planctomycetota bacterium]|jgi:hypothetical protein